MLLFRSIQTLFWRKFQAKSPRYLFKNIQYIDFLYKNHHISLDLTYKIGNRGNQFDIVVVCHSTNTTWI